ncbi:MAG TPA: pyridoxamine 5'-phosphate oxidase family protein [Blastocatellia bacterium]|nr:pyridoxamine 5'-phosphate oxidase family protein [Blastocatellia bacterium]
MKELSPTLKEFCEKEELLRFTYLDGKGYPRAVPVWFVVFDGEYYFGTGATSEKWKAVQRDPRSGWLIDGGPRGKYKGASWRGRAEEVTDPDMRARIYNALGAKYFGSHEHPEFVKIYGQADDAETVYVRLIPEHVLTWEY